jgi:phosphate starvation-inducible membrane PsiE
MKNNAADHTVSVRIILITAAVLLLTAGVLLGDNAAIFRKAVFICMECIGIG